VEPCKYVFMLILAIVMAAFSVVMIVHTFCYVALKVDGKTVSSFLN